MKIIVLILFFINMISVSYAEDKTITICSFEWPPHHGTKLKNGGYTADIIRGIFEPQGYKINTLFLPWQRAQSFAKEGKECDAITEIYFNNERLQWYWYGAPYVVHKVYVIALKSHPVKEYNSLRDLAKYSFGHNRGGSLAKAFDAADYLTKIETMGYASGVKMLLKRRIDFFVSAWSVALYEAQKLGEQDKIHPIGSPLQQQYVHMAFSKKNPKNLLRLQDYNQGLFSLMESGRYHEIMKSHGVK